MADTVREYAIKLSAETSELVTGIDKATMLLEDMGKKIVSIMGGVDKSVVKATEAVNNAIGTISGELASETQKNIAKIAVTAKQQLDEVKGNVEEQKKIYKQASKDFADTVEQGTQKVTQNNKQMAKDIAKELKDTTKEYGKAVGAWNRSISEVESFGRLTDDVRDLKFLVETSYKEMNIAVKRELKRMESTNIEEITDGEKRAITIIEEANKRQLREWKEAADKRIDIARRTNQNVEQLEKELQRDLEKIQLDGAKRIEAVQRTASKRREDAPKETKVARIGYGGDIISELGGAAPQIGVVGGLLNKLGPAGIAAGAGIGLVAMGLTKASEASATFTDSQAKVKTALDPSAFNQLSGSMERLKAFSAETGVPLNELSESLFQASSAVGAFKTNTDAGASAVMIAAKAAKGLDSDAGQLTSVMGDLANSFSINATDSSNLQMIMDNVTVAFQQGKMSGQDLASTIVTGAKSMSALVGEGKDGVKWLTQMTAAMTSGGVDANKTSTAINALNNEFLNMQTATKLVKAGLGGVSTAGGKVQVDFEKMFASVGNDTEKFAAQLSSVEAKLAFRSLTAGGSKFADYTKAFQNVAGAADATYNIMADTSKALDARFNATLNNFAINMGGTANAIGDGFKQMGASALGFLNDLMKTSEQKSAEAQSSFNTSIALSMQLGSTVKDTTATIQQMNAEGVTEGATVDAAIAKIGQTAASFQAQFPLMAADIQAIINAPGTKTVETLTLLNEKLAETKELANAEAFLNMFQGADEALDAIGEKMTKSMGKVGEGIGYMFEGNMDVALEKFKEKADETKAEMDALRDEQKALANAPKTAETAERIKEIQLEYSNLAKQQQAYANGRLATETGINQYITQQLNQAKQFALANGDQLNVENQLLIIKSQLTDKFGEEGMAADLINQKLNEKGALLAKEVGDKDYLVTLEKQRLEDAKQLLVTTNEEGIADGTITEAMAETNRLEIEKLDNRLQTVDASNLEADKTWETVDAQDEQVSKEQDLVSVKEESVDLEQEKADISSVVNDMAGEILGNEELSTEEKLRGLEALWFQYDAQESLKTSQADQLANQAALIDAQIQSGVIFGEEQAKAEAVAIAIRQQVAALREEAAIASSAASQVLGKMEGFKTQTKVRETLGYSKRPKSGGGGGKSRAEKDSDKAAKDSAREAEKAEKDRQKAADDAEKERQKRAKEAQDAEEKLRKEREKRAEEAEKARLDALQKEADRMVEMNKARLEEEERTRKLAEAMAMAEKKLKEDLLKFANDLQMQNAAFLKTSFSSIDKLLEPFKSKAQTLWDSISGVIKEAKKSREDIEKEIETRRKAIATSQKDTEEQRAEYKRRSELPSGQKITEKEAQIGTTSQAITDIEQALKDIPEIQQRLAKASESLNEYDNALKQASSNLRRHEAPLVGDDEFNGVIQILDSMKQNKDAPQSFARNLQGMNKLFGQLGLKLGDYSNTIAAQLKIIDKPGATKAQIAGAEALIKKQADTAIKDIEKKIADLQAPESAWAKEREELARKHGKAQEEYTAQQKKGINLTEREQELARKTNSDIEKMRDRLKGLKEQLIQYNKELGILNSNNSANVQRMNELKTVIDESDNAIKKLNGEIEELNKQISGTQGQTAADAQQRIKEIESLALGYSEVSKLLDEVIALQEQAFQSTNLIEAVKLYDQADKKLKLINEDLALYGISLDDLNAKYGMLIQNLSQENIESILAQAFPEKELTDTQKAEKDRTRILLTNAVQLLKLQTNMKEGYIESNEALESMVESQKQLAELQSDYATALDSAKTFIEENSKKELTNVQALEARYQGIKDQLKDQIQYGRQIAYLAQQENAIIESRRGEQVLQQERLRNDLLMKRLELQNAIDIGKDATEVQRLTDELSAIKNQYDAVGTSIENYNKQQEENNRLIEESAKKNVEAQMQLDATKKALPAAKETATLADINKQFEDAGDNIRDIFKAVKAANKAGFNDKAYEGTAKGIQLIVERFSAVAQFSEEAVNGLFEMQSMLQSGDKAGAILKGTELVQKIGSALLNAKTPELRIAGAVIMGVGLIAGMIAKIVGAIKGKEETELQAAERTLAATERQNDAISRQIDLIDELAAMGDASVDTAQERLDLLEKQKDILAVQNKYGKRSQADLLKEQKLLEDKVAFGEEIVDNLEKAKEYSNDTQADLIRQVNEQYNLGYDFGKNITKSDIDQVIAKVNTLVAEGKADLSDIELMTSLNEDVFQAQMDLLDAKISQQEFIINVATALGDTKKFDRASDEQIKNFKDKFASATKDAGIGFDVATIKTLEDVEKLGATLSTIAQKQEIPQSVMDSYIELRDIMKKRNEDEASFVESQLESSDQLFELWQMRADAGKVSTKEAKKQQEILLQEQIDYILKQIDLLGMTNELEMLLLQHQKQLNDLKKDGNAEDEEANRLLTEAVRARQKLIELYREQQKGGTMTANQQASLAQSTQVIVDQLKANGASEEEIQAFVKTLPAYSKGGKVPKTGMALVSEGEYILTAKQLQYFDNAIEGFANAIAGNNYMFTSADPLTQRLSDTIIRKEQVMNNQSSNSNFSITVGDVIVNTHGNQDAAGVGSAVKAELRPLITNIVQRAIDQNKLDLRGKGL